MSGIVKHSLTRIVPVVRSNMMQKATMISGPPKNPMPFSEKVVLGGTMCGLILTPMLWILANVKHYKNPTGAPQAD
ncbi:cytochrome c oxidase polypeptide VIII [Elysia marginata]|uniref:Cytochrome c oxidase polypeptide VIII n=1 Tax=Elysia marginata TaxID=1093978 RepID=A0AAV4IWY4_9GAST|nr:cytochrome c oxidase polypeptide VIII [Elysia marginata]